MTESQTVSQQTPLQMVAEFHRDFRAPIGAAIGDNLDDDTLRDTRIEYMREELEEYVEAATGKEAIVLIDLNQSPSGRKPDIIEMADALADIVYFAYGAAVCYGIDLDAVLEEVHASNMAKKQPDGTVERGPNGKVIKPEGWAPPQVARVIGVSQSGKPL